MEKKANIKNLENAMYDIFPSLSKDSYSIEYIDFSEGLNEMKAVDMPDGIMKSNKINENFPYMPIPTCWKKVGDMNSLTLKKNILDIGGEPFLNEMIKVFLKERIQKDFIEKIKKLSELNRLSKDVPSPEKFDLNLQKFKDRGVIEGKSESESIFRRILSIFYKMWRYDSSTWKNWTGKLFINE